MCFTTSVTVYNALHFVTRRPAAVNPSWTIHTSELFASETVSSRVARGNGVLTPRGLLSGERESFRVFFSACERKCRGSSRNTRDQMRNGEFGRTVPKRRKPFAGLAENEKRRERRLSAFSVNWCVVVCSWTKLKLKIALT